MFGLLCLKQVISFYIPQPLQLKKKTPNTFLSSSLHPILPDFLVIFFVCFIMSWRQAQCTLLKCIFSNHSSKRAVWFESSSQQEITARAARRGYETHRWVTRCWKQVQPRRWTQQSHRSGNSQQQVSRCLFAAILATSSGIRKAHLQTKQGTCVNKSDVWAPWESPRNHARPVCLFVCW